MTDPTNNPEPCSACGEEHGPLDACLKGPEEAPWTFAGRMVVCPHCGKEWEPPGAGYCTGQESCGCPRCLINKHIMECKPSHSPLPFSVCDELLCDANGVDIGEVNDINTGDYSDEGEPSRLANAEFVSRACNAHYELVAACEIVCMIDTWSEDALDAHTLHNFKEAASTCRAALSKARGEG